MKARYLEGLEDEDCTAREHYAKTGADLCFEYLKQIRKGLSQVFELTLELLDQSLKPVNQLTTPLQVKVLGSFWDKIWYKVREIR